MFRYFLLLNPYQPLRSCGLDSLTNVVLAIGIGMLCWGCATPPKIKSIDRGRIEAAFGELETGEETTRRQFEGERSAGTKPVWIEKEPLDPLYYHGIGASREDWEDSKVRALGNLASQIKVQVKSVVHSVIAETGHALAEGSDTGVEEGFIWVVETLADQTLQDFELVDKWRGDKDYWTYVRISKAKVEEILAQQLDDARTLALDHYRAGADLMRDGDVGEAVKSYIQGLIALHQFLGQPVQAELNGKQVLLNNALQRALSESLTGIDMTARSPVKMKGEVGKPLSRPLVVELSYEGRPIVNFPVSFAFVRGKGRLSEHLQTDHKGLVGTEVYSIATEDYGNTIEAYMDLTQLVRLEEDSPGSARLIGDSLLRFGGASVRFSVSTVQTRFYVNVVELNSGKSVDVTYLANLLKGDIVENTDAVFTPIEREAHYTITGTISTRPGRRIENRELYTAYATVAIALKDRADNVELFKRELTDEKAGGNSFSDASRRALKKAAQGASADLVSFLQEELSY
jgi:hypothetical protein